MEQKVNFESVVQKLEYSQDVKATEAPVPAVKPKHWSHAQVLVDAAQKQADLEALLEEMKENQRKLAEIEIDEEETQEMEDDAQIENLCDLEDLSDEDEPFFPVNDDIELDDADLDGVDESVTTENSKVSQLIIFLTLPLLQFL